MSLLRSIETGRDAKPPRLMVYGNEGVGKAQPLTAKVLTPQGFVQMGDLKVGDRVIGADGKAHNVLAIFPQGRKPVFQVTFRDGSQTECCDEHLWFTQTRGERDRGYPGSVRKLQTIRRSLRYGTHFNHAVPRVAPVEFAVEGELPIDPWLLGIYLAEGNTDCSVFISNPELDILERIAESIPQNDDVTINERGARIRKKQPGSLSSESKQALVAFGLDDKISDTKFIPQEYLHASIVTRKELLRGLCDGDGHVCKPGAIEICTASKQMAREIVFLIRSLGGSAVCRTRPGKYRKNGEVHIVKDSHRIYGVFTNGIVPVSSAKQTAKWKHPEWMIRHTIRSVEEVGEKECQCIVIDALDSLYVTDDFIVTHNSTFGALAPSSIFIQTEDGLGEIDCAKFPLAKSFTEVQNALIALRDEEHDFQTAVIDSADWLESLVWDQVCNDFGVRNIEKADGGYGRGYSHALTHWRKVVSLLDELRNRRSMLVIIVAHSKVERFEDPENAAYNRYTPRLHKQVATLITVWHSFISANML